MHFPETDAVIQVELIGDHHMVERFDQDIQLIYVLEGQLTVTLENKKYQLASEDILLINSGLRHQITYLEENLAVCFRISLQCLQQLLRQDMILFLCNTVLMPDKDYTSLKQTMHNILNYYINEKNFRDIYLNSQFYDLIYQLCTTCLVVDHSHTAYKNHSDSEYRMQVILSYIHSNYQRNITLQELADKLFISNAYLSKYIKKQLGMSFLEYLNRVRLNHAVHDLIHRDTSIMKIALDNGFANASAFTRLFKEAYHELPSIYKAQHKPQVNEENTPDQILLTKMETYLKTQVNEPSVQPPGPDTPVFTIDVTQSEPLLKSWKRMINIGAAIDLLNVDTQNHIRYLKKTLGFRYVRFWDIFSQNMHLQVVNHVSQYNFSKLDKVIDFLLEIDMIPYMDIGFKFRRLLKSPRTTLVEYAASDRFSSKKQAEQYMEALMTHLVNRYGIEAMQSWYFELWKDEYIGNLFAEDDFYYDTFQAAAAAIKKYVPEIRVGGGGFSVQYGRETFVDILNEWSKYQYKPDFISVYIYPFVPTGKPGRYYAIPSTDEHFMKNLITDIRHLISQSRLKPTEFHISEWNITPSSRNIVNDSCNKGAYIMKNLIDTVGMTDLTGYWVGSDTYADYPDVQQLLMGAGGLLSKDMIPKPAFYAFEFMNRLGKELIEKGENYLVSAHGYNNYSLVCHNYIAFTNKYYLMDDSEYALENIDELFAAQKQLPMCIRLNGLVSGNYQIKTYTINRRRGSLQDEWLRMGLVRDLSRQEIKYLENICVPQLSIETVQVFGGTLTLDLMLEPSEIRYIFVKYVL